MRNYRERAVRNRSKNMRTLTIREIKMAICAHEKLTLAGTPEQRVAGGVWRTTLICPSCGAWEIREVADDAAPSTALPTRGEAVSPAPAWEDCTVELRCQERGIRAYPLCRYDAIARGPAGRYVAARSRLFDNGLAQAERQAILDEVGRDLAGDGWEPAAADGDRPPCFRRRLGVAMSTAVPT